MRIPRCDLKGFTEFFPIRAILKIACEVYRGTSCCLLFHCKSCDLRPTARCAKNGPLREKRQNGFNQRCPVPIIDLP